jgi:molecular chaperone HtpG
MNQSVERHEFQAEVKQLLDLMVHSLYSEKDVFLRELVSNASDALDKLRFEQITRPELAPSGEFEIRLAVDNDARTLSISDNGIGMTRAEVVKNIGTIAKSGTKEFLANLKAAAAEKSAPNLIGQFGVGFYSVFMVADAVSVLTRRAGEATATFWKSEGDGTYTLAEAERDSAGTTVTLHLKDIDAEQGLPDFTQEYVIKDIIKRYSDSVGYPIRMAVSVPEAPAKDGDDEAPEADDKAKKTRDETLNSMKAIWDRPKEDVTDAEYKEFYRNLSHDWNEPLRHIPIKIEGALEAYALLYIPTKASSDLYSQEMKRGVQLYVKRVFVMDECKDLMPSHLRFIKGVVDAHDLSLNVSREILQKDRQIPIIRKQLVKKVLGTLRDMKNNDAKAYLGFWEEFGPALKEGLLGYESQEHDKLLELVMAPSTHDKTQHTSLEAYIGRMKPGQDAIYVLTGASQQAVAQSPLLENFIAKGYEVLLFADTVDEIWLENAPKFKEFSLKNISRGDIKLGSDEDQKKESESLEAKQKELSGMLAAIQSHLDDELKEVRLSTRLTASAACLVGDANDPSPRMQKIMEQFGQKSEKLKRILELNPSHAIITKLQNVYAENGSDPRIKLYADLLLGQAHLAESAQLPDPAKFSKVLAEVMLQAS